MSKTLIPLLPEQVRTCVGKWEVFLKRIHICPLMTTYPYGKWSFCLPKRRTLLRLIAVTNDKLCVEQLVKTLFEIVPYVDRVILRERNKTVDELEQLLSCLRERDFPMEKCVVHGNPKLAMNYHIPTVQLPGSNDELKVYRERYPMIQFGKSIHSIEEAVKAEYEGAQYALYGHIFPTACKEGVPSRGTKEVARIVKDISIPLYVIGGILPEHIPHLKAIGVSGIAVMSTIFEHAQPAMMAKKYHESIYKEVTNHDENDYVKWPATNVFQ